MGLIIFAVDVVIVIVILSVILAVIGWISDLFK